MNPRVNPRKPISLDLLKKQLGTDDITPVPSIPLFYQLPHTVKIAGSPAYKAGRFYGMDLASAIAVCCLAPLPGEHVLDVCCAPGAKLCMIGDALWDGSKVQGSLAGVDINKERLFSCRTMVRFIVISLVP